MKDNSLNNKLNMYFEKNPNLDKSMIIRSLENLIEGKTLDNDHYKLLKSTGFFDIVYKLNTNKSNSINEVDLFKIRSKITKLYDLMTSNKQLNIYDYNKLFSNEYDKIEDKKLILSFEKYNDLITNKIFEICQNKISNNKGKFDYSQEIISYLDNLIRSKNLNYNDNELNSNYLKDSNSKQITAILDELNVDNSLINIDNKEELELLHSVYQDSENVYFNEDDSVESNSYKQNIDAKEIKSEISEIKEKFTSMFNNHTDSSRSINFLIDNSKNLENNLVTLVNRLSKIEEDNKNQQCKINILDKARQNRSKMDHESIFNDIEKNLREFKGDIGQLETKYNVNDKEIEVFKNRLSILDSDLSKHKECVVNSFEIIEERLTQLFKSMIVVNNNIKHCYSNTEKMYTEISNRIK